MFLVKLGPKRDALFRGRERQVATKIINNNGEPLGVFCSAGSKIYIATSIFDFVEKASTSATVNEQGRFRVSA